MLISKKIEFAKTKSDAVAKLDGTFVLRTYGDKTTSEMNVLGKRPSNEDNQNEAKIIKREDSEEDSDDHA